MASCATAFATTTTSSSRSRTGSAARSGWYGRASTFEGKSSRFEGDVLFREERWGLATRLRYVLQLGAYRDLSIQFTPLDRQLGEYEPYHELYTDVRKAIGEHFSLGGGFAFRELRHDRDEGPFNHEFRRYFGLVDVTDFPIEGSGLSLLAEWYRSDVHDRTFQGSGELWQEIGAFRVGGGTSYALYKFDEFFLEERARVRTYFASLEWRPAPWLRTRLGYSFEDDDEDHFHVGRLDVRISF